MEFDLQSGGASPRRTPTVAQQLAALVDSVSFEQLPPEVVREARRRLLDALGCMIAGAAGEPVRAARAVALELGGGEQATLIGVGRRTSVEKAALANCAALRQLDYMDGHHGPYPVHASFNIPPVLAVAEWLGSTGAEVVRAVVLGYEVNVRLLFAAGDPNITAHGWNGSTLLGISSALATGTLLGLSAEQLAHAAAISTTHAPALDVASRGQIPESKVCVDGMVVMSAVVAALLAQRGMTGPRHVFEGSGGFQPAVARRLDTTILLAPVNRFRILDVYTKRYNSVMVGQTAVAAALALRESLPKGWSDVEQITLGLAEWDYHHQLEDDPARRRPQSRDTANHSLVYCVAAALVDGDLRPEQFEAHRLSDPSIHAVIDRINLVHNPTLDEYWPRANPVQLEIVTRGGKRLTESLVYSPGHPANPLSDDEIEAKFRTLGSAVLDPQAIETVIRTIGEIERLENIRPLMELVGAAVHNHGVKL